MAASCAPRTCCRRSCTASSAWRIVTVVWVIVGFSLAFAPSVGGLGIVGGLDFVFFNGVGMEPNESFYGAQRRPVRALRDVPDDVRGHHAGAHQRRLRRAQALRRVRALHDRRGRCSSTRRWPTWSGAAASCSSSARSTSRAARSSTSPRASPRWSWPWSWAGAWPGHHVEPHDVPMTVLGAGLLWFGWFGFNAGSALAANGLAAQALMVTTVAAAAGTLTWVGAAYATRPQGQRRRCRGRCRRRPRGHHPGGRLRDRRRRARPRPRGRRASASAPRSCATASPSTTRSTSSRSTAWAACGAPSASGIFAVASIGGVSGLIEGNVNQLSSSSRGRVHGGLHVGHDLRHHQGHRLVLGLRVATGRRGGRPRPRGPRRDGLRALVGRAARSQRSVVSRPSVEPATCPPPKRNRPDASSGVRARSLRAPRSTTPMVGAFRRGHPHDDPHPQLATRADAAGPVSCDVCGCRLMASADGEGWQHYPRPIRPATREAVGRLRRPGPRPRGSARGLIPA